MDIKNIIFDLGGVFLNIDYHATIKEFKALGVNDFENFFTQANQNQLFDRLDVGSISVQEFRNELRAISGLDLSDSAIDKAWNAMILDFPQQKIPLIEMVGENYRTFLLSNTNAIHYPVYSRYLKEDHGFESLEMLFEKQYLSHEIGMRKPNVEIFQYVLEQNNLVGEETLFFDDTLQHVLGARKAGLHAYWIDITLEDIISFFEKGKLKETFFKKLQNQTDQSNQ